MGSLHRLFRADSWKEKREIGQMGSMQELLTWAHALGGVIALVSMWVPLFSAKGGVVHRKAGRVFVWAMAWVSMSAVVASARGARRCAQVA